MLINLGIQMYWYMQFGIYIMCMAISDFDKYNMQKLVCMFNQSGNTSNNRNRNFAVFRWLSYNGRDSVQGLFVFSEIK